MEGILITSVCWKTHGEVEDLSGVRIAMDDNLGNKETEPKKQNQSEKIFQKKHFHRSIQREMR